MSIRNVASPIDSAISAANAEVVAYRSALGLLSKLRCHGCGAAAGAVARTAADIAFAALAEGDAIRDRYLGGG
jgi:hypothetical protein